MALNTPDPRAFCQRACAAKEVVHRRRASAADGAVNVIRRIQL